MKIFFQLRQENGITGLEGVFSPHSGSIGTRLTFLKTIKEELAPAMHNAICRIKISSPTI